MTAENGAENAHRALDRARAVLAQAQILRDADHADGAVSRAYYAAFHAARAMLLSLGLEPRSHRGMSSLVGQHLVLPGTVSSDLQRALSRLQKYREEADYDPVAVFSPEDADREVAAAGEVLAEAERVVS